MSAKCQQPTYEHEASISPAQVDAGKIGGGNCRKGRRCYLFFNTCSGLPLRLVEANSSNCFWLIDSYILFDAPLSLLTGVSPRLAARAAPAAFCCALDFAGIPSLRCKTFVGKNDCIAMVTASYVAPHSRCFSGRVSWT